MTTALDDLDRAFADAHDRRGHRDQSSWRAVAQRAETRQAPRTRPAGPAQERDTAPLGHRRPARHPQRSRPPHRVHRRVQQRRRPGEPARRTATPPAAAHPVRAGHQRRHRPRRRRRARRTRSTRCATSATSTSTPDNLRRATARVVNATLAARDPALWGSGTACASDSKRFGSWSGNLMTEWHARYGGPGVMIYWHVETRTSLCVYSQLKICSSTEVAAMIEGVLRHGTDARRSTATTSTPTAQSAVGFAFTHLLGFRLLPRLKNIGSQRLYRPDGTERRLAAAEPRADPADPLGPHRPAVRPDGQVRDRAAAAHRRGRGDPAPLHPPRPPAPHLRRARRARPRGQDRLRRRLPALSRPAPGDQRRAAGRRELELRPTTPSSTARTAN